MAQKITFYPLGNAETCMLELSDGQKLLFDYAAMKDEDSNDDKRYDIKNYLSDIKEFEVVMFSHPHEDHVKGASNFFYLEHAKKYQSDKRAIIKELWVSAAFLLETDLENQSDAKIIRNEARYRLKEKRGIRIIADPDSLTDWLESQDIDYEDVKDLIIHAGQFMPTEQLGNEISVFVHAPFSDDSEEVQDKNEPSIVLQLNLKNGAQETNILITGDTTYKVLDKIVERTKSNKNEAYLQWDIYDIPHHCSRTALNEKSQEADGIITPTENVQWLLKQAAKNAYMVASCEHVTELTSPPHMTAKKAYEKYTENDVSLKITMDHTASSSKDPQPMVFTIDQFGVKLERIDNTYFNQAAPRAG